MDNLCKGFESLKIQFAILDIFHPIAWPELEDYSAIVICTEEIWRLPEDKANLLESYVQEGGGMLIAYRSWHEELIDLFGLSKVSVEPEIHTTTGLSFKAEIFPGVNGLTLTDNNWLFEHSRYDIEQDDLSETCTVLASDLEGRPIAWTLRFGEGRVSYWNTNVLFCRALRGLVAQNVLASMEIGVGAVMGFGMIHIDDFPTSMSNAVLEPIATEYPSLSCDDFVFKHWHEDMMQLREKHRLTYTWYTVMNYHDTETSADADRNSYAVTSGEEILRQRFELAPPLADGDEYGFHGYNHEPLIAQSWPDLPLAEYKLKLARDLWNSSVPWAMPTSWVPTNNWYQPDYITLVKTVFPEISIVCSLFSSGDPEFGEYREFGPDPFEPAMTCLPRETFGYIQRPEARLMMLSEIATMGVWTHFVHPDDVYDVPQDESETAQYCRNSRSLFWKLKTDSGQPGLYEQFDAWVGEVRERFPWLEFVTTSEAAKIFDAHTQHAVDIRATDSLVEITSETAAKFYIRTPRSKTVVPGKGGQLIDRRDVFDGSLSIVRCSAGKTLFQLRSN